MRPIPDATLLRFSRRRLRRLAGRLGRPRPAADPAALLRALARLPDRAETRRFLLGSQLHGWCHGAEEALGLIETQGVPTAEVFDRVAATTFLILLAPRGRAPADLKQRARRLGRRLLRQRLSELPLLCWGWGVIRRPLSGRVLMQDDPEEGKPASELWLGGERSLLRWTGRRVPREARYALTETRLELRPGRSWELAPKPVLSGGPILIGNPIVSGRRGQRVAERSGSALRRFEQALALIDAGWPAAGRWVRRRTVKVVPLIEPGTVSYSLRARPGVSFICTARKTILQLADDLVHENAHHELHWREALGELERSDGSPAYYSPWRRSMRPLRGIVHACFTFLRRAELFERLLASAERRGGRGTRAADLLLLRRGLLEERSALEFSLMDLNRAELGGELTSGGRLLLNEMREDFNRLNRSTDALRNRLRRVGGEGRSVLAFESRFRGRLERRRRVLSVRFRTSVPETRVK